MVDASSFIDPEIGWGELITYHPGGDTQAATSIYAVVERDQVGVLSLSDQTGLQLAATLFVSSDDVPTPVKGKDTAMVSMRQGATPELVRIVEILTQDDDAWTLGVVR